MSGFSGSAPTTTLIALADELTDADDGAPPTILSGGDCVAPQLVGSTVIDSPDELTGWAVALGDYRNRAKAQKALQDAQTKLGKDGGRRPAGHHQEGRRRPDALQRPAVGPQAGFRAKDLQDPHGQKAYCVALSPKMIANRF